LQSDPDAAYVDRSTPVEKTMNVLIVSENRRSAKILAGELQEEGIRSSILSDPVRMRSQVGESRPDLVLLDVDLEKCDCWQLLLDLKAEYCRLPALVYVYDGPECFGKLKQAITAAALQSVPRRNADGFYRRPMHREYRQGPAELLRPTSTATMRFKGWRL
jgi:CheY-like chemotaxis protein